jgi:hypothetical protein
MNFIQIIFKFISREGENQNARTFKRNFGGRGGLENGRRVHLDDCYFSARFLAARIRELLVKSEK